MKARYLEGEIAAHRIAAQWQGIALATLTGFGHNVAGGSFLWNLPVMAGTFAAVVYLGKRTDRVAKDAADRTIHTADDEMLTIKFEKSDHKEEKDE